MDKSRNLVAPAFAFAFVALLLLGACGSDGGGSNATNGAGGSGTTGGLPTCDSTCPGVLAAKCTQGPVSQADCVSGCESVRSSPCAAQYRALYDCGGASPKYTCTASGQVAVAGCDAQTNAFWACVSGP